MVYWREFQAKYKNQNYPDTFRPGNPGDQDSIRNFF